MPRADCLISLVHRQLFLLSEEAVDRALPVDGDSSSAELPTEASPELRRLPVMSSYPTGGLLEALDEASAIVLSAHSALLRSCGNA
jgi:hypothetical protein